MWIIRVNCIGSYIARYCRCAGDGPERIDMVVTTLLRGADLTTSVAGHRSTALDCVSTTTPGDCRKQGMWAERSGAWAADLPLSVQTYLRDIRSELRSRSTASRSTLRFPSLDFLPAPLRFPLRSHALVANLLNPAQRNLPHMHSYCAMWLCCIKTIVPVYFCA